MNEINPYTTCNTCKKDIDFGAYFCGLCGAAQLQSMLLPGNKVGSITTAHYDPFGPDYKPWRDVDHLFNKPRPKMPLPVIGATNEIEPIPWHPTMKTTIHNIPLEKTKREIENIKRKDLLLRNSRVRRRKDGSIVSTKVNMTSEQAVTESIDNKSIVNLKSLPPGHHGGVIYFKEHAFQRRQGRKPAVPKQRNAAEEKRAAEALSDQSYERGEQTIVHAVAAYEAHWMIEPGYTIHVSLIDRSHYEKEKYVSRYFLRVGIVYEQVEPVMGSGDMEEEVHSSDLMVLDVIQNDIGRLLTNPKQYWVDLNLIKPDEYYMTQFLQDSLVYIAQRVRASPSFTLINLIDQICLVEPVYESEAAEQTNMPDIAVITEQDLRLFKRRHKRALQRRQREHEVFEQVREQEGEKVETAAVDGSSEMIGSDGLPPLSPGRATPRRYAPLRRPETPTPTTVGTKSSKSNRALSIALGPPGKEVSLTLDKTVAQRACRITVGQLWEDQVVLAMARMSVRFPDADNLLHDELPMRKGVEDVLFSEVPATQISIHILPLYSEMEILPKIITFDVAALKVFLGPSTNVDNILKEGFSAANQLLYRIVQLLHFERVTTVKKHASTDEEDAVIEVSYKLAMTGVATIPFERPVKEYDSDSDSEEVAGKATKDTLREVLQTVIASVAVETLKELDAIAREQKAAAERAHKEWVQQQCKASLILQSLWRGALIRSRRILDSKRALLKLLRQRAERGALLMQVVVRSFLAKCRVLRKRREVERQNIERENAAKAEEWMQRMGLNDAQSNEPDAGSTQTLPESPKQSALEAWMDAYDQQSKAISPKKEKQKYDVCACHGHRTLQFDTLLKDTNVRIYGLYNCGGICEFCIREDRAALKTMFRYKSSLNHILSKGDGRWNLALTVQELPELEPGETLNMEALPEGLGCGTIIVDSQALEDLGSSLYHELMMIRLHEEEKESPNSSPRSANDLASRLLSSPDEDPEQEAWEDEQWRAKTPEQLRLESLEEAEIAAIEATLSDEERHKQLTRKHLHGLMMNPEHKAELFRRICAGIRIMWQYDGALIPVFDLDVCMELYEVFYDDEGDLVVGI